MLLLRKVSLSKVDEVSELAKYVSSEAICKYFSKALESSVQYQAANKVAQWLDVETNTFGMHQCGELESSGAGESARSIFS